MLGIPFFQICPEVSILAHLDLFMAQADEIVEPLLDELAVDDADGARDGRRFSDDAIRATGNVIAAGSRHIGI